jgi:divalent metal cation (Fe/Co/Zn/Cd) transporter
MSPDHRALVARGRRLGVATIAYNSIEGIVALAAGAAAGSIALVGFGVDSLIELSAGGVALWRLGAEHDEARRERVERLSLRLVGWSFLALALYVAVDAVKALAGREAPEESTVGILLAIASLVVMPLLARAKRRVALGMRSGALAAEAQQTALCTWLSAILLGGLVLNATLGWWWADPIAALAMVPIIAREGWEGVRGRSSCDCHSCAA